MELLSEIDEKICYDKHNIHVIGTYQEPWFIAKDICTILGIKDNRSALRSIPEKWRGEQTILTRGGNQITSIINEAGLYRLIMRSNKEIAQKFQEVVCEEILPSLRRKGEYKIQSIIDKNKQLEEDSLKKDELNAKIEAEKAVLAQKLLKEQTAVIKTKKSLEISQKKFSHRHKFPEEHGCVYILKDPDNRYNKYKIGFTHDINKRLTSDRTMIPQIKVLFIMHTPYYKLFENIIKIKYEEKFEYQSHEWIIVDRFENENFIINGLKDINRICEFKGKIEVELWRYNLEPPPAQPNQPVFHNLVFIDDGGDGESKDNGTIQDAVETEISLEEDEKLFDKQHLSFAGKLSLILPTYLLRYAYDRKNEVASEGSRYCNAFCQMYQPLDFFPMKSLSPLTICIKCDSMIDIANIKILNGVLTAAEIRQNPKLLEIKDNEKICRKCNKIKNKDDFPEKRRQCKQCRNATRSQYGKDFENQLEKEVEILESLTKENRVSKIGIYVKDELQKIMQFLKIGRKFNDTKQTMAAKIIEHYEK
jgi:prophage antirepressor-like protein